MKRPAASAFSLAVGVLALAGALGLLLGSVPISIRAIFAGEPQARAILALRIPRVLIAALAGGSLAMAGAALQALLQNPLADPFLLGTSGGAAAGAALAALFAAEPLASPIPAFAGAAAATFGVVLLARRQGRLDLNRLLLAGVTANAFFSAVILGIFSFASAATSHSMLFWMMGSLAEAQGSEVLPLLLYFLAGAALLLSAAPRLNLFLAGEESAASLGVSVEATKVAVFLASALLAGAATSFVGIVGFVGLMAPHLTRFFAGNDQRILLPCSALVGAALVVAADTFSRFLFSPAELPLGAVTAIVGVPFFLYGLRRMP
jgi:iron complex transport system permease protein